MTVSSWADSSDINSEKAIFRSTKIYLISETQQMQTKQLEMGVNGIL